MEIPDISEDKVEEEKSVSEESIQALKKAIESKLQLTELEKEIGGEPSQQELLIIPKNKISKVKKKKKKK